MIGFVAGAVTLLVLTLGLLAWPLLRRTPGGTDVTSRQLTATVYRDKLAELDQDLAAGSLTPEDHAQSRNELQRRLLEDSSEEGGSEVAAASAPKAKGLLAGVITLVPLVAFGLYTFIGNPSAMLVDPNPHSKGVTSADVEKMIAGLAAKLEKEPDNHRGWAMLARSYKTLGRYDEAVKAYAHAGPLLDESPDLLVDYADAVASVAQGFNEQSQQLLEKALKLEPNHAQGLWMRGSASFDAGRFDRAIADWEKLLAQLPAESEEAQAMRGNIAEAKKRAGGK